MKTALVGFFLVICVLNFSCSDDSDPGVSDNLGQVKIELKGLDTQNELFSLFVLDTDSTVQTTKINISETSDLIPLESGEYQFAIRSNLRTYTTAEDLVFSGHSDKISLKNGDTVQLEITLSYDDRAGWISVPNVPLSKRFAASSFVIDNNVYIGFGSNFNNERFQDWWVYSVDNNTWGQLADFPGGKRFNALSFSIGSKGYICMSRAEDTSVLPELWEFESTTETWTQLADFPGNVRESAVAFAVDGKAYVGSGSSSGLLKDFYSYDPSNNEWTQISDFVGDATYGFTSFTLGDIAYLVGGVTNVTGEEGADIRTRQFAQFNSSDQSWNELSSFPGTSQLDGVGFSINGNGYFGLGSTSNSNASTDLWVYNPTMATWKQADSFIGESRFSQIHGSNGTYGYFGFGQKDDAYNDLFLYYPSN